MAKKAFVNDQTVVTAADLNGWEVIRADLFDEKTSKAEALAALGGVGPVHPHSVAIPSVNGFGGNDGFISANDLAALRGVTAPPTSITTTIPDHYLTTFMSPSGQVVGITFSNLVSALSDLIGGGGGPPTEPTLLDGGESESSPAAFINGGELEDVITTYLDGGEG